MLNVRFWMEGISMRERQANVLRYVMAFLLIALLCGLFPYTGDDWAWGSRIGLERLDAWFSNYNGRYVGNMIVLVLTRSNLLKAVVMALFLMEIVFCAECIFKQKWAFYLSLILLALIPKLILRQAVVWTAGFSNYVTSVSLTLLYIVYIYPVFHSESEILERRFRLWHSFPLFALAILNALIVEHLTIYNVVLAMGVLAYALFVCHKLYIPHMAYFLGSICGAAYMFSNGAYHAIASNQDTYRQIAAGGVVFRAFENYINVMIKYLCLDNVWINMFILVICLLLYRQMLGKIVGKWTCFVVKVSLSVMIFYNIWAALSSFEIITEQRVKLTLYCEAILVTLYMLALLSYTMIIAFQCHRFWEIAFWELSIICIAAPLLVVNPIGERCFFATYIMFGMLFLELLGMVELGFVRQFLKSRIFSRLCGCICLADRMRLAHIKEAVASGESSAEIIHYPYESYIWCATPANKLWSDRYKLFYGLPDDLKLKDVWNYSAEN